MSEQDILHEWEHPPGEHWRLVHDGGTMILESRMVGGDGTGDWERVTHRWSPASLPEAVAYEILRLRGSGW